MISEGECVRPPQGFQHPAGKIMRFCSLLCLGSPRGSASAGGDLQQYGCSTGRARLGTGTLGPASGLRPHWSKEPSRTSEHLTPLEVTPLGLTSGWVRVNLFSPAFGHASLRPCSASALQRPLISSYPAPSGNEGSTTDPHVLCSSSLCRRPTGRRCDPLGCPAAAS